MRLILRIVGTLLIACAVILLIIDGTKSLGANTVMFTSMGESWRLVSGQSLEAIQQFVTTRFFGPVLEGVVNGLLNLPGWAVIGVPGLILAWAGRSRRTRVFVRQEQL